MNAKDDRSANDRERGRDARIGVMHLIDTLEPGGAERVAVNLVNHLSRERFRPFLCTTRGEGALEALVREDVPRLRLRRRGRFDLRALRRLVQFNLEQDVALLHAHSTTLFLASLASLCAPYPKVIWHDHYGRHDEEERAAWLYRPAAKRASGIIAVNEALRAWSQHHLGVDAERVWYVPNFSCDIKEQGVRASLSSLPGVQGKRLVCVANLRPQKDHLTLLRAMRVVVNHQPDAHLLLVGATTDAPCVESIKNEIASHGLQQHITLLGSRQDVSSILRACDVGVLSSASEGLPLALIEYGLAQLPVVATRVGQCGEVLDEGRAGRLVPPGAPERLASALLELLSDAEARRDLGALIARRVREGYSAGTALQRIEKIYDGVLSQSRKRRFLWQPKLSSR